MPVVVVCFGYHLLACLLACFVCLFTCFFTEGNKEEIPIRDLLLFIPYLYSHNPRMDVRVLGQTGQYACVCMSRFQLDKTPRSSIHSWTSFSLSLSLSLSYRTRLVSLWQSIVPYDKYYITSLIPRKQKTKKKKSNNAHSALRPYDRRRGIAIAISIMPIMPITNSTRVIHNLESLAQYTKWLLSPSATHHREQYSTT